jgi:hypothetical protein
LDRHVEGEKEKEGGETIKMKINYKRSLKFVTLLILSILIATVSATTYMYMYIQSGQISITTGGLQWLKGVEADGATISGATVTGLQLSVLNGTETFFNHTLYIKNTDQTTNHTFSIEVTSSSGNISNFEYMYLKLYDNATDLYKNCQLDLLNSTAKVSGLTIPENTVWRVSFHVKAYSTATSGTVTFTVKITYA